MTRTLAAALTLISAAGWGQASTQPDEPLCERGDRAACHRLGLEARADGGTTRAWMWLGRACELGEPKACDDAAADANVRGKWSQAEYFEEQARRWRANPIPQVELSPAPPAPPPTPVPLVPPAPPDAGPTLTPEPVSPEPEPEPAPPPVVDAGRPRPLLPEIPGDGVMRAIVTPPPEPPPPRKLEQKCLDDAEYARNALVASTKNDPTAFRPSALWLPPFFMTDAERSYTWAALLYFESKDFEEGSRTRIVPPFFASHCAPESQTLLTPFYSYRTDADGTASLLFTYFRRRDRLVETDILFPFVWSLRERKTVDAPLIGSGAFLPFAFWRRDAEGNHFTAVPPVFWRWGDADETTTLAGTVYWHEKASEDRFDLGIPPLYFGGRGTKGSYDVSPLLFWSFRDEQKHSLFLPLLLTWYQSRADGGTTFSAGPLLFVGRDGPKHHTVLAPLFWRWGDDAVGETNTAVGNVFLHETKLRTDLGVVPLYFRGRSENDAYDVVPPLFWSFREPTAGTHTLYLPALLTRYQSRAHGWSLSQFPFLWAGQEEDRTHVFLPPLFWLWADRDDTNVIAANVFVHRGQTRSDFGVVPLYFGGRGDDGSAYDVSPLLFWDFRDARKHSLFLPAALTYFQSRAHGFTLNQFPLLWSGREGKDHHVVVPPLFWHWGDGDEETTLAASVFWHRSQQRLDWGFAPLFFHGSDFAGRAAYDVSPLLFWSFREGPKHTLVVPPLLAVHHDDGHTSTTYALQTFFQTREYGYTLASFPFVWFGREGDAHHEVVAPLFFNWGDDTETTSIAGPAYHHHAPNRTHFGLAPLYFGARSTAGSYDVSPLLFWSFRDGLSHRLFLPPLLTYTESDGETETTVALQTYFQRRPGGFTLASVPFLFAGREGKNHHFLVPPLFWRWGDREATTTIAGPVFVREGFERTDWGVVPLYFRGPGYDVSPPLFWSFRTSTDHTLVIPPLLAFHHGDGDTETTFAVNTFVQTRPYGFTVTSFPFLFLKQEGDTHYAHVPPLFFRWGDKDETTTIAGPAYFHQTPTRHDFGLAPLYFQGRGPDGDYDVTPLFLSYRDQHRASLVILPLLTWYQKDDELNETAWVLQTYFQSRPYGYTLNSFPFLFAGQNGDDFHTFLPPLFWYWGNATERTAIAGPVYWNETPTRSTVWVPPFFFSGFGEDDDYLVSPALFWAYRTKHRFRLVVPPLLSSYTQDGDNVAVWALNTYFASRENGFSFVFAPLLFMGENGLSHHTFVPPLFWRWGEGLDTTTVVANTFFHETPERWDFGLVPLYFKGESLKHGAYDVSPPLFWSFRHGPEQTLVLPPLLTYWQQRKEGHTFAQVPFFFDGREGSKAHTVSPLLFWNFRDDTPGAETNTLFVPPLLTYFEQRPKGFTFAQAPLLFLGREGQQAYTVSPLLFWSLRDETPGEEQQTLVLPALLTYLQTRKAGHTFAHPLLFTGREAERAYTVSPLLFWSFRDADANTLFLPPLLTYLQTRSNGGFTFAQAPLLFLGRDPETGSHHTLVPPLFWRWGDRAATTTLVGPLFHRSNHETEDTTFGLAPVYFGQRNKDGTRGWDVAPLFYRSFADDEQHMLLLPFFDYRSKGDSKLFVSPVAVHSSDAEHTRTIVGGLFWNMTGPDVQATIAAPLWWDFKLKKSGSRVSTVFPLYWRYEKPEEVTHLFVNLMWSSGMTALGKSWSFHLFPLFDLVSYHPKHFLWQVLGGLLGHESQADSERWRAGWVWMDPTKRASD